MDSIYPKIPALLQYTAEAFSDQRYTLFRV